MVYAHDPVVGCLGCPPVSRWWITFKTCTKTRRSSSVCRTGVPRWWLDDHGWPVNSCAKAAKCYLSDLNTQAIHRIELHTMGIIRFYGCFMLLPFCRRIVFMRLWPTSSAKVFQWKSSSRIWRRSSREGRVAMAIPNSVHQKHLFAGNSVHCQLFIAAKNWFSYIIRMMNERFSAKAYPLVFTTVCQNPFSAGDKCSLALKGLVSIHRNGNPADGPGGGLQPSLVFLTPRYMWGVASSNGSTSMEELSPDDSIPAICRLVDYSNSARYGVDLVNLEQVWSMGWVPFSATAWK